VQLDSYADPESNQLQLPGYRTVLVNGSRSGVGFYPLNAEQDFGDAHAEVRYSTNVSAFGAKSENNFAVLWIRDSDLVSVHGYGGNASPFGNATRYHAGWNEQDLPSVPWLPPAAADYATFMPSLFRVQRSTRIRFANIMNSERVNDAEKVFYIRIPAVHSFLK